METKLWALLIPGPDEVWAMASKEKAEADAELHNAILTRNNLPEQWGVSLESVQAQVIEWPYSAEEHADALMNGEPDVLDGDGDPRPETPNAGGNAPERSEGRADHTAGRLMPGENND